MIVKPPRRARQVVVVEVLHWRTRNGDLVIVRYTSELVKNRNDFKVIANFFI